jgi:hypothetical protein
MISYSSILQTEEEYGCELFDKRVNIRYLLSALQVLSYWLGFLSSFTLLIVSHFGLVKRRRGRFRGCTDPVYELPGSA